MPAFVRVPVDPRVVQATRAAMAALPPGQRLPALMREFLDLRSKLEVVLNDPEIPMPERQVALNLRNELASSRFLIQAARMLGVVTGTQTMPADAAQPVAAAPSPTTARQS